MFTKEGEFDINKIQGILGDCKISSEEEKEIMNGIRNSRGQCQMCTESEVDINKIQGVLGDCKISSEEEKEIMNGSRNSPGQCKMCTKIIGQ